MSSAPVPRAYTRVASGADRANHDKPPDAIALVQISQHVAFWWKDDTLDGYGSIVDGGFPEKTIRVRLVLLSHLRDGSKAQGSLLSLIHPAQRCAGLGLAG